MPAITVGSHSIWYDEFGRDHVHGTPAILLVPGLGATRLAWWKQIAPFASTHRVLNMDNRDAGDSGMTIELYSIADMADDAAALLTAVGAAPAFVVGWSMGTFISLELTLRHPALVARLVLVAGSPGGPTAVQAAPEIRALLARDEKEEAGARVRRTHSILAAPGYMDSHPEDLDHLARSARAKPMPIDAYRRQLNAIGTWSGVEPRLPAIATPTLVIHGNVDPLIPFENGRAIAARVPGATLLPYAGVGHLPPIEAADRFNRDVLDFLDC
jgi:3-oxoadipate enol-lactonase